MHKLTSCYLPIVLIGLAISPAFSQSGKPDQSAANAPPTAPSTAGDSVKLEPVKTPKPTYPLEARDRGLQGRVLVEAVVSEAGKVENVVIISGDPVLAKAAVAAARKWRFKPFIKDGKPVKTTTTIPFNFGFAGTVEDIKVPPETRNVLRTDAVSNASAQAGSPSDGSTPTRVQVPAGVIEGMLIHKVAPVYPPEARRKRISGTVVLTAFIGKEGSIEDLKPISGPEELVPAAVGAVQQWRYRPYVFNGEPVAVQTTITVNFILSGRR